MSQWAFVLAAYSVALLATIGLVVWAYMSMRNAEADADAVKRSQ